MKRLGAGAFGAVNLVESGDSSRAMIRGKVEMIVTFEKSLSTYLLELQVIENHWYVTVCMYTVKHIYIHVFNKSYIFYVYIYLYVFLHVLSMYVCLFVCM